MPLYYEHVLGVSGTIQCLPKFVEEELNNYGIPKSNLYVIPSVYGENNNRIVYDPVYFDRSEHYTSIMTDLEKEFKKGRPILLFFREKEELINFFLSPCFLPFQKYATYLTEEHSEGDR